jgi:hypothetical protein
MILKIATNCLNEPHEPFFSISGLSLVNVALLYSSLARNQDAIIQHGCNFG